MYSYYKLFWTVGMKRCRLIFTFIIDFEDKYMFVRYIYSGLSSCCVLCKTADPEVVAAMAILPAEGAIGVTVVFRAVARTTRAGAATIRRSTIWRLVQSRSRGP